jgi:hypothetical protein
MANNLYNRSFTGNKVILLASAMRFEATRQMFWGKMAGFTTKGGIPVDPNHEPLPTGSPITIQNEFKFKQGDKMQIPMLRALRGIPTIGSNQMAGFEERFRINHATIPIDILRHAGLPQEGSMMTQTTKDYQIIQRAKPQLQKHYSEVMELLMISYAFYYGFSHNIIDAANTRWSGETYIKKISHPNIFIAGQGRFVPTGANYCGTAGYETQLATALGNVATNHVFNTTYLKGLKAQQQVRRIQPIITKDGNRFRLIVAHPYQIDSLENDPVFNAAASAAFVSNMVKDNPMLIGCKHYYAGFMIYDSDTACWPVRVASSVPQWGPSAISDLTDLDDFTDYEDDTLFACIILGADALFRGVAAPLEFKGREADYGEIQAIAYRTLEGASRADYWNEDDGTRGDSLINDGSAIGITYASVPQM